MSTFMFLLLHVLLICSSLDRRLLSTQCLLPTIRHLSFGPLKARYYSNFDLSTTIGTTRTIKPRKVIIVIHGVKRNADKYYRILCKAAKKNEYNVGNGDIMLIAPNFINQTIHNPAQHELYWNGRWRGGGMSKIPQSEHQKVSSYQVIDSIIQMLFNQKKSMYPNLKYIAIIGHSAGGQFVQRYALTNKLSANLNKLIHFVVANPSSFAYLDSRRWFNGETYRELTEHEKAQCPKYNEWKHGLQGIKAYSAYFKHITVRQIKLDYIGKNVTYLQGTNDDDENHKHLAKGCEDKLQGSFRLERGINFERSLEAIYGTNIFKHRLAFIPSAGHSPKKMFTSKHAKRIIFGDK